MRVLLIEDDCLTTEKLRVLCGHHDIHLELAGTADAGLEMALQSDYELIMMDLVLPDSHGLMLIREMRTKKVKVPIIVMTGQDDPEQLVEALAYEWGADDFIVKPYKANVLIPKMRAVVRRSRGHADTIFTAGSLNINISNKRADIEGKPIYLTGKEFEILELLSLRKGSVVTKEAFLDYIYKGRDEPELKIIDVFVCKLRKKLTDASDGQNFIETIWGRGYMLRNPDDIRDNVPSTFEMPSMLPA